MQEIPEYLLLKNLLFFTRFIYVSTLYLCQVNQQIINYLLILYIFCVAIMFIADYMKGFLNCVASCCRVDMLDLFAAMQNNFFW